MLSWLANRYEKSFKNAGSFPAPLPEYYYRKMGRRTEVRRIRDGILYMVLWDLPDSEHETVAKAAHLNVTTVRAIKNDK